MDAATEITNFAASCAALDLIDAYYEEDIVPYDVILNIVDLGPAIDNR